MKIKKLLKDYPEVLVKGSKEVEITGVCANSKLVSPGNLFVAKQGKAFDGQRFIPEAISAGAVAILSDIYDPTLKNVAQIVHPHIGLMEARLAAQYYQNPSQQLYL